VAASLVVMLAMPACADDVTAPARIRPDGSQLQSDMAYSSGMTAAGRPTSTLLPDERDEPMRLLALVGPVVVIVVLTILGLTITFRALSHDRRERRIVYRRRGHRTHGRAQ
jgi:hypothetical protein